MMRLVPFPAIIETTRVAITYQLLKERPENANISHANMPSIEEHRQYVLRHPYRTWFLIEHAERTLPAQWVGSLYLTNQNEIGIFILAQHQRKGYAARAIKLVLDGIPPLPAVPGRRTGQYLANVNPSNEASIKLFTGLGAVHLQNTYTFSERGKPWEPPQT